MKWPWVKERMQFCRISTEDGRLVDTSLPVELGYLIDRKMEEAYIMAPSTMIKDRKTGKYCVILDERDGLPPPLNEAAKVAREHYKANINKIGHENWRQGFYSSSVNVKRFLAQTYLSVFAVGTGCVLVAIFLITYIASGKFKMPNVGG